MNKLNIKLNFKFLVLLLLALRGGSVFAESGRIGAGIFGFEKNNAEGGNASPKEILRQKQAKKAAAPHREKSPAGVEQDKESNPPNPDNSNLISKKSRMTPDERRALRRQIHDAGNDVYVSPK